MPRTLTLLLILICCRDAFADTDTTFEEFFRSHNLVTLLIDPDNGNIVDANNAATAFYGYSNSQFRAMTIQEINLLSAEQVAQERLAAKSENRNYFIFRHRLANGTIRTIQVYSSPITVNGRHLLFSIIRDISTERETQQQLWHYQTSLESMVDQQVNLIKQQSKRHSLYQTFGIVFLIIFSGFLTYFLWRKSAAERQIKTLSQIVEQSPISIATLDEQGQVTYCNAEFETNQYIKSHVIDNKDINFIEAYLGDNPGLTALQQKIADGEHWQGELVSINNSQQEYWEMANVYPLSDAPDSAKHVVISQDITRLKEHEKQLRLVSTVFHTATEAVMICDINNKILAVNKAFSRITGYAEEEVIGQNPSLLKSGHHDSAFYQRMFHEIRKSGNWQGEISNRRKNGEIYYEWLSITALTSPNGEFEAYVSLFNDITKRKSVEDKIYHQANFDGLTGLANRHLFSDRLKHSMEQAKRHSSQLALLFIDLDGFKQVNDTLGHSQGDLLLQQVSQRLAQTLRASDMIARLGGDEFAVIVSESRDIEAVGNIASKVIREISKPFNLNAKKGYVSASVGIAIYPEDGSDVDEFLTKADSAMYKAKASGRNNFQFFTKEMDHDAEKKRLLMSELRAAVSDEQFEVWFQPIHHCQTGSLTHAEALARWNHPKHGMISPEVFIAIAEEIGLISQLGRFVLQQACEQAVSWESLTDNPPSVAVNVSSIQFQQQNFVGQVEEVLANTQLAPQRLVLEITESLLIADNQKAYDQLKALQQLGISISLDDFGTGYSSLSYLKRFPINKLKIDKSFIQGVGENNTDTQLVSAIASMANSLQMKVVAEGVETALQLEHIKNLGCEFVQGYVFSKPLPLDEFCQYMLAAHNHSANQ